MHGIRKNLLIAAALLLFVTHGSVHAAVSAPETFGPPVRVTTESTTEKNVADPEKDTVQEKAQAVSDIAPAAGAKPEKTPAPTEEKQPQGRWWDRPY